MTKYYLEVIKWGISICLDTDVHYYHEFEVGDIIHIHMYSDAGPKVVFGQVEYDAEFRLDWDKRANATLTVASCIIKGYLVDVTKGVQRQEKLKSLGI
jgi:hypothetical protein